MFEFATLLMLAADDKPADTSVISLLGPPLLVIFAIYMLMSGPQRKEQRRRDDLLKALKKNDRVMTIGGIIGTVANISADGKEVTVKVDDNTRIRFRRTAIHEVLSDETALADGAAKPGAGTPTS